MKNWRFARFHYFKRGNWPVLSLPYRITYFSGNQVWLQWWRFAAIFERRNWIHSA